MTEHCSVRSFTSTGREGALCRSFSLSIYLLLKRREEKEREKEIIKPVQNPNQMRRRVLWFKLSRNVS